VLPTRLRAWEVFCRCSRKGDREVVVFSIKGNDYRLITQGISENSVRGSDGKPLPGATHLFASRCVTIPCDEIADEFSRNAHRCLHRRFGLFEVRGRTHGASTVQAPVGVLGFARDLVQDAGSADITGQTRKGAEVSCILMQVSQPPPPGSGRFMWAFGWSFLMS